MVGVPCERTRSVQRLETSKGPEPCTVVTKEEEKEEEKEKEERNFGVQKEESKQN